MFQQFSRIVSLVLALALMLGTIGVAAADTVRISPEEALGTESNPVLFGTTVQMGSLEITINDVSVDGTYIQIEGKAKNNRLILPLEIDKFDFRVHSHVNNDTACWDDGGDKVISIGEPNDERTVSLEAGKEYDLTLRCEWTNSGDLPAAESFYYVRYKPDDVEVGAGWGR